MTPERKEAEGAPKNGRAAETTSFHATISSVVFQNERSGFAVLRVRPDAVDAGRRGVPRDGFICRGCLLRPRKGQRLRFEGRFTRDPRYGWQFAFDSAELPEDGKGEAEKAAALLSAVMDRDLAESAAAAFGAEAPRILEEDPGRFRDLPGGGDEDWEKTADLWRERKRLEELGEFLEAHGFRKILAAGLCRRLGAEALGKIRENPWLLAMELPEVSFEEAEILAVRLGLAQDAPGRAEAALLSVLEKAAENGDVCLPAGKLVDRVRRNCGLGEKTVIGALGALAREGRVRLEGEEPGTERSSGSSDGGTVYLADLHDLETGAARGLGEICRAPGRVSFAGEEELIRRALEEHRPPLARAQAEAVRLSARGGVLVVTGGPGTGKTTVIRAILGLYERKGARVRLAAPTGRAARRMTEATGREAATLHRLLEYNPLSESFLRCGDRPLDCDLLVVDEASMMDIALFSRLVQAVPPGCTLVLTGDTRQLPSVGPGAVLADIIASGLAPVVELTEIFRQAATSGIVRGAHLIDRGVLPDLPEPWTERTDFFFLPCGDMEEAAETMVRLIAEEIPRREGLDPLKDIQLITPMRKGAAGVENMNRLLQKALNPPRPGVRRGSPEEGIRRGDTLFRPGDRVMQNRNDYDKDVFNGDPGIIADIDRLRRRVAVRFDDRTVLYGDTELDGLDLAYACTIHKSQGSEYPAVVVPLFLEHGVMLQRNLLYTAITRGRKLVILTGEKEALEEAVRTDDARRRRTGLARRLSAAGSLPAPGAGDGGGAEDRPRPKEDAEDG